MKALTRSVLVLAWLPLVACASSDPGGELPADDETLIDEEEEGEGVAFDEENPGADIEGKADMPRTYEVPTDLPELERPEIIVSLDGLSVHLFDRATGFSEVYPTGVGQKGSSGKSITPAGFFKTSSNTSDTWYYTARRYTPDYFGGFPFLRLNIKNSAGAETYALHGPISYSCPGGGQACGQLARQWKLKRGYVSHGCMRMAVDDIVRVFWIAKQHPSTPVTIQREVELDANGAVVDVGTTPALFEPGEAIQYGKCGTRPDPYESEKRWVSTKCD